MWTKTGNLPRKFHASAPEAEKEAARLARKFPGKKFIVLNAYQKVSA